MKYTQSVNFIEIKSTRESGQSCEAAISNINFVSDKGIAGAATSKANNTQTTCLNDTGVILSLKKNTSLEYLISEFCSLGLHMN